VVVVLKRKRAVPVHQVRATQAVQETTAVLTNLVAAVAVLVL
jgi:hypothetical protein